MAGVSVHPNPGDVAQCEPGGTDSAWGFASAEDALLDRLQASSQALLRARGNTLWAALLEADLHCLALAGEVAIVRSVPQLADLLALPAQHSLTKSVLRTVAAAVACAGGAKALRETLWGARRLVKLAGSLDLDDEARRLLDEAMACMDGTEHVASLSGRVAFEHVHRIDMFPPTRLAFHRPPSALLKKDRAAYAAEAECTTTGGAWLRLQLAPPSADSCESGAAERLELCLANPSRRERFGSEIPSKVWPAAVIMSQWLWNFPHLVRGRRVLELGAGMGLAGLAAMHCEAESVLLTDLDTKAILHMRTNLVQNAPPAGTCAEATNLDWARPPDRDAELEAECAHSPARRVLLEGADVVLAADIVNAAGLSELVYEMLVRYLSASGDFFMVCPKPCHRHTVDRLRTLLLESTHFECTVVDVPPWLSRSAQAIAAGAEDMEPAEFEVIEYELYHTRWRI
ncbi:hypothetical protein T492DRAFT_1077587 [Pavlovales sp. CCMP2436]|nr:hypothetical protein T492DRAFT_1077587 [Pavlovales sp. CCMP2436]